MLKLKILQNEKVGPNLIKNESRNNNTMDQLKDVEVENFTNWFEGKFCTHQESYVSLQDYVILISLIDQEPAILRLVQLSLTHVPLLMLPTNAYEAILFSEILSKNFNFSIIKIKKTPFSIVRKLRFKNCYSFCNQKSYLKFDKKKYILKFFSEIWIIFELIQILFCHIWI